MSIIEKRTQKVSELITTINNHHMCMDFTEDGHYYVVIYPSGMRVDGVRIKKGRNKSNALGSLLKAMDRHWEESGIN